MAAVILKKGKRALSGYVIYLITGMVMSRSFCFASFSLGAYNWSPRARGHLYMLTPVVVNTCQNEISFFFFIWAEDAFSTVDPASAPLLCFYHCPSLLFLSFAILGIMQVLGNILKLIKASQTPCLIIHREKTVVSTIQTALWCCPVV